jgi:hypothetical protein
LDLDNLTPDMVRQALAIYLREGFPDGIPEATRSRVRLPVAGTVPEMLDEAGFVKVSLAGEDTSRPDIYKLEIGSHTSPRMKFCVKRVSLSETFLFNVDIHDLYLCRPEGEETEEERGEREASEKLKRRIEELWGQAGLPTFLKYMEDYLDQTE